MAVNAQTLGAGTLTIGASTDIIQLASQVTEVELAPEVDRGDPIRVLSGESVNGDRTENWTLSVTFLTDLGETTSVWEYLFENRSSVMPFTFTPNNSKGKQINGSLTVEAASLGGEAGATSTSEVEFSLVGEPTISAITP
ncbi:hypothetical protein ACIOJF_02510 [Glutamicibacter sp. NPDC087831]|uniref:hypothetical protein n=1 Tax=Glutamicibacter sp. NPDC087831 TaxID=3363998 RepID=UPI00381AF356